MSSVPKSVLKNIAEAIRLNKCIPILGAGVSADARGKTGLPLGGALAKLMLEQITNDGKNGNITNPRSLPEVATHYQHYYKRFGLFNFLKSKLPHQTINPLPAHEALAKLPFRIIITTNL